jgi:hypothetical protein
MNSHCHYQSTASLPINHSANATHMSFHYSRPLLLSVIIYNSQAGPGVAINSPKPQWLRQQLCFPHQRHQVALYFPVMRGYRLIRQPSFQTLTKGKRSLECLKPIIKCSFQRDTGQFCSSVLMSHMT